MNARYISQAEVLNAAGFFVSVQGHFDVTAQEIAELLQILNGDDSLAKATELSQYIAALRNGGY